MGLLSELFSRVAKRPDGALGDIAIQSTQSFADGSYLSFASKRTVGDKWNTGARWYERTADGTKRIANPNAPGGGDAKGPRAQKAETADASRAAVEEITTRLQSGAALSTEDIAALPQHLSNLSGAQQLELKRALGVKGGRTKAEHVNKLLAWAHTATAANEEGAKWHPGDPIKGLAKKAISDALANPSSVNPRDLAEHLSALTSVDIAAINKTVGLKGDRLKTDRINRLLEHIRNKGKGEGNGRRSGSGGAVEGATGGSGPVAPAVSGPGNTSGDSGRELASLAARPSTTDRVSVSVGEAHQRINRVEKVLRAAGNHQVADWLVKLKDHVSAVGDAGLTSMTQGLGNEQMAPNGKDPQYEMTGSNLAEKSSGFVKAYLGRYGITAVATDDTFDKSRPVVSGLARESGWFDRAKRGAGKNDYLPANSNFANKLEESQSLPGLETSADINDIAGHSVTHLTPDVTAKLDTKYGKGQWIVKAYGLEARAGFGIFFPQRAEQIATDARAAVQNASDNMGRYGFTIDRDADGKAIGVAHVGGDKYEFGSKKYEDTINGDVRHWGDKAAAAAANERGAELPEGGKEFMAQPAFPVVGISDADRAAGVTIKYGQEARVHITTKNGVATAVPYATWIKGDSLPVVFENDDTRAMAKAAEDAINAIPHTERKGQIYAPDIIKTAQGYKVVEANPSTSYGISGYLHDNPLIIDAYVSHVTGREPGHVQFIRNLLTKKVRDDKAAQ